MESIVLLPLVGAGAALIGALGSQWIAAWSGLKTRRLDLYFRAKSDAYRELLERLGEFSFRPTDEGVYFTFLAAYEAALLFASDEVAEALNGKTGLHVNAQRLRTASSEEERLRVAVKTWYEAAKNTTSAMRNDLKRLSGGLQ